MSREHTGRKPLSISQGNSPDQELNLLKLWSLDSSASKTARNRLCGLNKSHLSYFVLAIWAMYIHIMDTEFHFVLSISDYFLLIIIIYHYFSTTFISLLYVVWPVYILVSYHNSFELKLDLKTRTMSREGLYVIISLSPLYTSIFLVFNSLVHYTALMGIDWMHKGMS